MSPLPFLQVAGCADVTIPPHSSAPIDWQPLPIRPREARIAVQACAACSASSVVQQAPGGGSGSSAGDGGSSSSSSSGGAVTLTSQRFPIDDSLDSHLVLKERGGGGRPAPARGGSLRLLLGSGAAGASTLEARLAAQVVVAKHPGGWRKEEREHSTLLGRPATCAPQAVMREPALLSYAYAWGLEQGTG